MNLSVGLSPTQTPVETQILRLATLSNVLKRVYINVS